MAEHKKIFSLTRLQEITYTLNRFEKNASYSEFEASTRYCMNELEKAGFSDIERLVHEADGKTSAFDNIMPQAWDLTGRSFLQIIGGDMLADTAEDPIAATIWSAPTPEGGVTCEIIDYSSIDSDNPDVRGKWVFLASEGEFGEVYRQLAEAGAAGIAATSYRAIGTAPDKSFWYNGQGYTGWYHAAGEMLLPFFSLSPIRGIKLAEELRKGKVIVHAEMNTRIYDGKIYTVTARIPGESQEEIALFAHMYEPFPVDDAIGVATACELGRILKKRGVPLRKSLRVVFSMELYGYSAFLADPERRKNILTALNLDSFARFQRQPKLLLRLTPQSNPFFTDWFLVDFLRKELPDIPLVEQWGSLSDDTFAGDPAIGIPTNWLFSVSSAEYHHSSAIFFQPDWELAAKVLPVLAGALETLLSATALPDYSARVCQEFQIHAEETLRDDSLPPFTRKIYLRAFFNLAFGRLRSVIRFGFAPQSTEKLENIFELYSAKIETETQNFTPAECCAASMIVTRLTAYAPMSLAQVPLSERRSCWLDSFKPLFALCDGHRNLLECIRMLDAESGKKTSPEDILFIIDTLRYLEKYEYVKLL